MTYKMVNCEIFVVLIFTVPPILLELKSLKKNTQVVNIWLR